MARIILTFETLFQVLAAEKVLRTSVVCRPTPVPPGLSTSICGMAVEILELGQIELAKKILEQSELKPTGIHELD